MAHRVENYVFNAKSIDLKARKNLTLLRDKSILFQIRMFLLNQQDTYLLWILSSGCQTEQLYSKAGLLSEI